MEASPDLRFSQILYAFNFVKAEQHGNPNLGNSWSNEYYIEPDVILERVEKRIKLTP